MTITTGNAPKALTGESGHWMQGAVKHPGSLRATAKREGLIKGDEKLSSSDLNTLAAHGSAKTRERVGLARAFREAQHNDGGCAFHRGLGEAWSSEHHA